MTTEQGVIDVNGLAVEVVRKNIKHLYVGVYPPGGRVRVSAPLRIDKDTIRLAVISRLGWIRKRQAQFEQQERQSEREYVSGESHYFEGRRYRLDVIEQNSPPAVLLLNNTTLALSVRPGAHRSQREAALDRWYRGQLRDRLPALVEKWEQKIGVQADEVRIRKMKTRWGTCNSRARRIWLNLELMKKPASCLEYVVVHELVHLLERKHNNRFREL
ncbi:MAG: SprT family zinc-dependent metalloprotease, partial [Gammaproteobacteria bacterium]|nr:SprT family zinc-dependent metalloprotease [Gammaproteobacteria bacterium]